MDVLKIRIDDVEIAGQRGTTILETAEKAGIHIPTLCYHRNLLPTGSCRICVVEVNGSNRLAGSCHTPIEDGMVIRTRSPKVISARKATIELLLAGIQGLASTIGRRRNANCTRSHRTWKPVLPGSKQENPGITRRRTPIPMSGGTCPSASYVRDASAYATIWRRNRFSAPPTGASDLKSLWISIRRWIKKSAGTVCSASNIARPALLQNRGKRAPPKRANLSNTSSPGQNLRTNGAGISFRY